MPSLLWDIFCRVIDNFGDIGVCWRLAADLASRGQRVRLWVDDGSALAWMAPHGHAGVDVMPWNEAQRRHEPGDVVLEAFGCDPPDAFIAGMAARTPSPTWINLEYLSAEDYVERSHGLPSPRHGEPGAGLVKHFFYPGFAPRTGGLLREQGLLDAIRGFDRTSWLAEHGFELKSGERAVSLFCYDNPALPLLLEHWASEPTLLLVTPGFAARQIGSLLPHSVRPPGEVAELGPLRIGWLPQLPQTGFDRLLWSCDLNFVRGEDSFVRAQWAGQPFVWQIYPQSDDAHMLKLGAFLDRFLAGAPLELEREARGLWQAWNGDLKALPSEWPDLAAWAAHTQQWRDSLFTQDDLATQLFTFVLQRKSETG